MCTCNHIRNDTTVHRLFATSIEERRAAATIIIASDNAEEIDKNV